MPRPQGTAGHNGKRRSNRAPKRIESNALDLPNPELAPQLDKLRQDILTKQPLVHLEDMAIDHLRDINTSLVAVQRIARRISDPSDQANLTTLAANIRVATEATWALLRAYKRVRAQPTKVNNFQQNLGAPPKRRRATTQTPPQATL